MTLREFVLERIAEDEAIAHSASARLGRGSTVDVPMTPDRLLAECEIKRRIANVRTELSSVSQAQGEALLDVTVQVLCLLAQPYSSHPDYEKGWDRWLPGPFVVTAPAGPGAGVDP